ncbi:MAG: RNA polymerase sigma factor [Kiritimatiellae bacterium]|nr:RNA polymerase sigma factor [Kiritimatiellia bacterium]
MPPDPSDAEDVALMLRAAADDAAAFSALVRKHEKPLANFFARNGVYRDVEDLAQLTFLKLHRARHGYRPTAKFTTFLYLLARQILVDHVRATQRRAKLHEEAGKELDAAQPAPRHRGEGEDAEAALACLSPSLRETVVLVVMQGLAYNEAADVLGIPLGTVKSRVSAALAQMKEFLSK